MNKVTIREVAKKANVSIATVSRVLNKSCVTTPEIEAKVLKVVNELGYQTNFVASCLKSGKSYMIGLIVPTFANTYFMEITKGIEHIIEPHGYNIILASTKNDLEKEMRLLAKFRSRLVDAIVVATSRVDGSVFEKMTKAECPIVLVDRRISGLKLDVVAEENVKSAYKVTNHLLEMGHRKIGVVAGIEKLAITKERFSGFRKALEESGLNFDKKYLIRGEFSKDIAYKEMKNLYSQLKPEDRPTAIFALSGLMAEGVMLAARDLGIDIPNDLSLVSFGNVTSDLISPKITSISQDGYRVGLEVGELLLKRLNRDEVNSYPNEDKLLENVIEYGESVKRIN